MNKTQKIIWTGYLALTAVIIAVCAYTNLACGSEWVLLEEGPLENHQAITLFFGVLIWIACSCAKVNSQRILHIFFALLYYTFLLREIPFKDIEGLPDFAMWLFHDAGRYITIIGGMVLVFGFAFYDFKNSFAKSVKFMLSAKGFFLVLGGVMLVCGEIAEKRDIPLMEETLETLAYVSLIYVSLLCKAEVAKEKKAS